MQYQSDLSENIFRGVFDTTKWQAAHDALLKSEETLAITLDSIGDGVISTDIDGLIMRMNRVAQKLTGWPILEAKGRHLTDVFIIVDSESGKQLCGPFESVMSSGETVKLAPNTTLLARDGVRYSIEDSASPIRSGEHGSCSGIVLVFRDVTQKVKLQAEFQQASKLETIGRLAGGIAHDFNNLLAGIMGYSELLYAELSQEPRLQGYSRSVIETSERAAKLTNQLLAFSRKGQMVSVPVDLHVRISSAVALLESTIDRRISIVSRLNAAAANVLGDPTLLESALLNIMINARDATEPEGVISIETNNVHLQQNAIDSESLDVAPGEYIEIEISDSGSGMSDEVKSHLYEPFFTTKDIGRGTGLGLAAVYGAVKEHRGAIVFKSSVGRGTSFKLYLPLCEFSPTENKEEDRMTYIGSGCILLVDDERVVRETASVMLQAIGYEVLLAENGIEALEIFKREEGRIQLVILDVVMPRLNGPDTFFALKSMDKDAKVIFSSGYTFDNGANELLQKGVFGFIQKPFRKINLYRVVQEAIEFQSCKTQE